MPPPLLAPLPPPSPVSAPFRNHVRDHEYLVDRGGRKLQGRGGVTPSGVAEFGAAPDRKGPGEELHSEAMVRFSLEDLARATAFRRGGVDVGGGRFANTRQRRRAQQVE